MKKMLFLISLFIFILSLSSCLSTIENDLADEDKPGTKTFIPQETDMVSSETTSTVLPETTNIITPETNSSDEISNTEGPETYVFHDYNEFIAKVVELSTRPDSQGKDNQFLKDKAVIVPTLNNNEYELYFYQVGYNQYKLHVMYVYLNKNTSDMFRIYIDYEDGLKSLNDVYKERKEEYEKNVKKGFKDGNEKGKIKFNKTVYKDTEYVFRDYIPDPEKDTGYKHASSTVDIEKFGHRIRLFYPCEFQKKYLDWVTFEKVDILKDKKDK